MALLIMGLDLIIERLDNIYMHTKLVRMLNTSGK